MTCLVIPPQPPGRPPSPPCSSAPKKRKKRGVTVVGDASKPQSVAGGAGAGRAVGGKRKRVADGVGLPAGAGAGRAVGGKRKRGAEGVCLPAASGAAKKRKLKHVNIPKVCAECSEKCLTRHVHFDVRHLGFFRCMRSLTTVEI